MQPKNYRIGLLLFSPLLALLLAGEAALAQAPTLDITRLTALYETSLQRPADSYLQSRIEEERARIRVAINQELTAAIAQMEKEKEGTDPDTGAQRQEKIVRFLEEERQGIQVDFALLQDEEKTFYLNPDTASGAIDDYRLTQNYADLLAKKAILEERLTALTSFLPFQQERLQKLHREQWLSRFSLLIRITSIGGLLIALVLLERFIRLLLLRRFKQPNQRYLFSKIFPSTLYTILGIWVIGLLFANYPGAITSLGIVGAGLAVALQDVVKDVVGWFVILYRRPFTIGHRITIGPYAGDVIDISVLRTTLLEVSHPETERTGKALFVPNSLLLTQPVLNYHTTSDYLKAEMQVVITYESDWRRAEHLLQGILEEHTAPFTEEARRQHQHRMWIYHEAKEPTGPVIYMEAGSSGIVFTLRFMIPIGARRMVTTTITRRILEEFTKEKIGIAYNTLRVIPTP
ncbi:mechanosensitive ion channel [Candidatus Peregrinibacteria bacterium]|nr:mechanosensitive ion channel [Candidatus Peregrinibacteria bacterium]MBI4129520.1 mechanosensitive ion channel [Candidatus Peregrinibacteria bacterium]